MAVNGHAGASVVRVSPKIRDHGRASLVPVPAGGDHGGGPLVLRYGLSGYASVHNVRRGHKADNRSTSGNDAQPATATTRTGRLVGLALLDSLSWMLLPLAPQVNTVDPIPVIRNGKETLESEGI